MLGHKAQPPREHHLRHPTLPYGRKRRVHGRVPRLARIGLQRERNDHASAARRGSHHADEARHATRVHRPQRVHLQEAPTLVLDEHDFRQHEPQPRERRHQLVGRSGIGGVETVEREEHRRLIGPSPTGDLTSSRTSRNLTQRAALAVLVFHIAQTGQRDTAAESHVAAGTLLIVVNELVGEPFLQPAERIHQIRLNGHIACVNSGHLPSLFAFDYAYLWKAFYHLQFRRIRNVAGGENVSPRGRRTFQRPLFRLPSASVLEIVK